MGYGHDVRRKKGTEQILELPLAMDLGRAVGE